MPSPIAELSVVIDAQTKAAEDGFKRLDERLKQLVTQAEKTNSILENGVAKSADKAAQSGGHLSGVLQKLTGDLGLTGGAAGNLSGYLSALGVGGVAGIAAAGLAAVGGGLIGLSFHAINAGSELNDLSIKTGLTVETLSGLSLQLKQSGTDTQTFAQGMFFLQRNLASAAGGSKDLQAAFERLGIKDTNTALGDMEGTLRQVARGLINVSDAGRRNALGAEVMGRAYKDLAVFIQDINGDIDQTIEQARRLGIVLSGDLAQA
ncbi:MAG TPA: hypothetical protein VE775_02240, partial [Pyrinomonadaceae bacterium]|nr:hypothetical protein [Pyrinomonadaceae bacterium]